MWKVHAKLVLAFCFGILPGMRNDFQLEIGKLRRFRSLARSIQVFLASLEELRQMAKPYRRHICAVLLNMPRQILRMHRPFL